jgi:hypothetical protein
VTAPDGLWIFDEATGDFLDRIGAVDLTPSGTPVRRVASDGHIAVQLDNGDAAAAGSTSDLNITTGDMSLLLVAYVPTPTVNRGLLGKRASNAAGYQIFLSSSNGVASFPVEDTAAASESPGATPAYDRWLTGIASWDRTADSLYWEIGGVSDTHDTSSLGSVTNTATFSIGAGDHFGAGVDDGTLIGVLAFWDGYALDATERQILRDFFA